MECYDCCYDFPITAQDRNTPFGEIPQWKSFSNPVLCQENQRLKLIKELNPVDYKEKIMIRPKRSPITPPSQSPNLKIQKNLTPFPSSSVMISALPSVCRACSERSSIQSSSPWNSGKWSFVKRLVYIVLLWEHQWFPAISIYCTKQL